MSVVQMLKEEVCNYGIDNVGISGLVAVILDCNIPDKTMSILLGKNLRELAEMTPEELMALPGIGRAKAIRLAAAFELARRLANTMPEDRPSIRSPENAAVLVMGEMRHLDREHFWALLLNTKNRVIAREVISIGTLNSSAVHPRELFKAAIRRSAAAVILVHNHPSGDPTPSQQDIEVTKRMVEAGNIVGINVLDHLVIGDNQFVSLKAQGLM
ncbi:DNA repair protein RadC [Desulfallas sp. Bu1-1]|nr:DNA repair protein RadC [Desulfallas sp. Bu1-1]